MNRPLITPNGIIYKQPGLVVPDLNDLVEFVPGLEDLQRRAQAFLKSLKGTFLPGGMVHKAGFRPDEGEILSGQMLLKNKWVSTFQVNADRIADLELLLFTNVAPGETITLASITEPTGTGYTRITLTDATWTEADPFTYPQQTFTAGSGGWTGSVQGYAIASKLGGTGTARLLAIEVDGNGPYTFVEFDTYKITPQISFT